MKIPLDSVSGLAVRLWPHYWCSVKNGYTSDANRNSREMPGRRACTNQIYACVDYKHIQYMNTVFIRQQGKCSSGLPFQ